jgi:FMN phosphatase YigB (HAD superfamily)
MIKAVIFDLGKVIIPFDFTRGYSGLACHCSYPAAEIPKRLWGTDLVQRFETGLVEPQDFVAQLSRILDLRVDYDGFCEIWSSIFSPDTLIPESMFEGLSKRYRLMLLSNTNAIHFQTLEKNYPLFRHFHDIVLSYKVRAMKPSPEIFRETITRAGCQPGECFFTDDVADNIEAAKREGMDAVQFQSCEQIEQELAARGLRWD